MSRQLGHSGPESNKKKMFANCFNSSQLKITALSIFGVLVLIQVIVLLRSSDEPVNPVECSWIPEKNVSLTPLATKLLQQRQKLSQMLNQLKQAYGQQSCELLSLKKVNDEVSENGGWCKATSSGNSSTHMTDKGFSMALSTLLKGKTVASFGDGPGEYKKLLDSYGEVVSYTAYDGAPYCEEVTGGRVKFLDLTAPQYRLPIFDWGISIEVAEHIPAKYETIFLDNLVRHVREGVILSWAVPGQGGLSHINNKAFEDVVTLMLKRGFALNVTAGEPLRKSATFPWLQKNVHVYKRISMDSLVELDA